MSSYTTTATTEYGRAALGAWPVGTHVRWHDPTPEPMRDGADTGTGVVLGVSEDVSDTGHAESGPRLVVDVSLAVRDADTGRVFYFGADDGTLRREPWPLVPSVRVGTVEDRNALALVIDASDALALRDAILEYGTAAHESGCQPDRAAALLGMIEALDDHAADDADRPLFADDPTTTTTTDDHEPTTDERIADALAACAVALGADRRAVLDACDAELFDDDGVPLVPFADVSGPYRWHACMLALTGETEPFDRWHADAAKHFGWLD
jgi:hypothetical protein